MRNLSTIAFILVCLHLKAQVYYTPVVPTEGIFYSGGWGINSEGEFQNDYWSDDASGMWFQDTAKSWVDISCGDWSCIGLKTDSTIWFWGFDEAGVGGQSSTSIALRIRPVQIGSGSSWKSIAEGNTNDFALAIKSDGTLWSWGDGNNYVTGQGSTTDLGTPTQVGSATGWTSISAGSSWACGIESGKLMTWGSNNAYRTGQGTATGTTNTPTQVGVATNWVSCNCGYNFGHAINSSGELWGWGENGSGRIGDGTSADRPSPVQCGTDTDWASVASGTNHSIALKTGGQLYACGSNAAGSTGQGTYTGTTNTLTQVGSSTDWTAVFAASGNITTFDINTGSFVINSSGHVYTFGGNYKAQIGLDESVTNTNTPVRVGNIANAIDIGVAAGGFFLIRRN